jgi:chemotaxis protein methyltransferase CheR
LTHLEKIQTSASIGGKMSDAAFERIAFIAHQQAGIVLTRSKESMVKSRLVRRLRSLKIDTFDLYLDYLESAVDTSEMSQFISALTTNVSHFFREEHHFQFLENEILPSILKKLESGKKVRIWSAGCSNGQEPYSIAMTLLAHCPNIGKYDIKILATDIDTEVLQCAMAGKYAESMTTGVPDAIKSQFFTTHREENDDILSVCQEVKDLVSFKKLNLHAKWPMTGSFDLIFCRNVVIYFDQETQNKLYNRYAEVLSKDGWLMLGHSERLGDDVDHLFQSVGVTTYQPKKTN